MHQRVFSIHKILNKILYYVLLATKNSLVEREG